MYPFFLPIRLCSTTLEKSERLSRDFQELRFESSVSKRLELVKRTLSRKDGSRTSRNQRNFCHDNETRIVNGAAPRSGHTHTHTHTGFKLAGFIAVVCLSVNGGDRFSKPIELDKKARLMADQYQRYSMFSCPRSRDAFIPERERMKSYWKF